jgi:hypothetical protein
MTDGYTVYIVAENGFITVDNLYRCNPVGEIILDWNH